MADTGIFATTAEVQHKCTAFANATYTAEAYTNDFMTQAESLINCVTGWNWSDVYASLNVDVKGILKMAASAKAAMLCIHQDTSGFPSVRLAELALDILRDEYNLGIAQLKDRVVREFINNPVSS